MRQRGTPLADVGSAGVREALATVGTAANNLGVVVVLAVVLPSALAADLVPSRSAKVTCPQQGQEYGPPDVSAKTFCRELSIASKRRPAIRESHARNFDEGLLGKRARFLATSRAVNGDWLAHGWQTDSVWPLTRRSSWPASTAGPMAQGRARLLRRRSRPGEDGRGPLSGLGRRTPRA